MKKLFRIASLVVMCVLTWWRPAWAQDLKIGTIDTPKVFDGTKEGKKLKDSLIEFIKIRQRLLDSEGEDIKKLEEDFGKQAGTLSPAAKQEKQEAFRLKVATYQRRGKELEGELQAKRAEVLGGFQKEVAQVARKIAERDNLALVIEKGDTGVGQRILFSQPVIDLTDRVIKEMDSSPGK